jgi:nitrogen regulatory protein PII
MTQLDDAPHTRPMTLVTIIVERLFRDPLLALIRECGATGHTLTEVTGEGSRRLHAHEWEGPSQKIETLVTGEVAAAILARVAERYFEHHSLIVYTTEVEVIRADRFQGGGKASG